MINKKLLNPIQNKGATKTGSGDVTLDTDQTITGEKNFEKGIFFEKIAGKQDTKIENSSGSLLFYNRGRLALKLNSREVSFNNQRLLYIGNPTDAEDAVNKRYADNGLALKQNKLTAGTGIDITDNVISSTGGGGSGDVTLDTAQNITGIKTFTNGIKNNLVEVDGKSLIIKNSNTSASYLEIESVYSGSGYKNWFGIQLFRTTGTSRPRLANLEIRQDDGLYIDSVNDLSFSANNIKFGNARLQGVRTPAADDDAATKKYADDGLNLKADKTEIAALDTKLTLNTNDISDNTVGILLKADKTELVNKQNKLTAGTGIDITGDTISSTTVVSPDTALTSKTNTFEFRQVIKSGGSGLLDLQNSTGSVLNTTYDLASTSVKLTSPNTTSMTFTAKDFNFSDKEIKNVGTPITNKSAANKEYVDTKQAKLTAGTNISIVGDVISSTGGAAAGVTLDTAQTITGIKTFENGIKNNLIEINGNPLIVKNSGAGSAYFKIEQVYNSGYKNWFGLNFIRTESGTPLTLSVIEVRQDNSLYIVSTTDLLFSANNIKFGNARLQGVRTPTADDDAATKKYVDDAVAAALRPYLIDLEKRKES